MTANLLNMTIGADPELFIFDKSKNKIISSIGIIPGVKGKAYNKGLPEGFGVQIDNILGEFNIPPSVLGDANTFVENVEFMKKWITDYVQNINSNYTIKCLSSAIIDEDELQSPEAKEFGCSVDYNVYTKEENPKPDGQSTNLRTTGFHIHIGYNRPTIARSLKMIYYMDLYLGVPSIILDKDKDRRILYGKAGCFRLTDYGFEYRVLSGMFLDTRQNIEWVHNQTYKAMDAYMNFESLPQLELIQCCINDANTDMASELIKKYNL